MPSGRGPSRRTLLGLGVGGLALLTLGGLGVGLQGSVLATPNTPLKVLDPRGFSVMQAAAEALLPVGDRAPGPTELHVAESIDAFLATCHPAVGEEISLALAVLENALPSLLLDLHPRTTFTAASPAERLRVLEAFRDSRIALRRSIFKGVLGLVTATYFGDAATFGLSGYTPLAFEP